MKISIITPTMNQARYIEKTIISVIGQKGDFEIEYIIMDGGSTDDTQKIIRRYEKILKRSGDFRVTLIWKTESDKGQTEAINKGLKMATGDIVAYINSDDVYDDGAFLKISNYFTKMPDTRWVSGKCRIIDENGKEIRKWITMYKNALLKIYSYPLLLCENFISQPATFWRKDIINELGILKEDEDYCMDYEYWLRIGRRYGPEMINDYLASFRFHAGSKSGHVAKKQFQDELRLAKKYGKKHPVSLMIHRLNYLKIIMLYKILSFLHL